MPQLLVAPHNIDMTRNTDTSGDALAESLDRAHLDTDKSNNNKVQEQVQKILDDACAEENAVPGLVFGMMDRKGNYLAKAAAGVRGLNRKDEKMTTDTAFAIYSCTKVSHFAFVLAHMTLTWSSRSCLTPCVTHRCLQVSR